MQKFVKVGLFAAVSMLFLFGAANNDLIFMENSSEVSTMTATTDTTTLIVSSETLSVTTETTSAEPAATTQTTITEPAATAPEEGISYKGIPWGSDFNTFKNIKNFAGNLSPFSAAFIGTTDDNDIALLLGVPVSDKDANGAQRVLFECVPRKFASIYYEPDDTYYIFFNGDLAMTFSRINEKNFDLYRDTFYKKYKKSGSFSKKYEKGPMGSYLLQSGIFEKGKTTAFLIKCQLKKGKNTFNATKLVFGNNDMLNIIRKEITDKIAAEKLSTQEKEKHDLEKDLNKIE